MNNAESLKVLYDVSNIEIYKDGNGVSDRVSFEVTSHAPIKEELAIDIQIQAGYHPGGYGFLQFHTSRCPVTFRYRTTWFCWANCD